MGNVRRGALVVLCTVGALLAGACTGNPPGSGSDTTPPVLTLPDALSVAAEGADGADVTWDASALDDRDGVVAVDCVPGPGRFAVGETTVECSASDAAGNAAVGSFVVTVGAWSPPGPVDTVTIGDETVTVTVPDELSVQVDAADDSDLPAAPAGVEFPIGAISIVVEGVAPGATVPVTITLETPVDLVRKLIDGEWDHFRFDGLTGARISSDGLTIELLLQDGGRGDTDGQADGRIVDPVGPANATTLTITTDEVPFLVLNEPAYVQFEAAGGEGPLTWSLAAGRLSYGLELGPDGVVSGTPWGPIGTPVLFEVTDGVSTARKVFYILPVMSSPGPVLTGATLPDGSFVTIVNPGGGFGAVDADGSYAAFTEISANDVRMLGGSDWVAIDVTDGVQVFDIDTGTPVFEDPLPSSSWVSFSRNGEYALVASYSGGEHRVFETSTWTVHRQIAGSGCCSVWSHDGSELVAQKQYIAGATHLTILSMTDPEAERTVVIDGFDCGQPSHWGATDRLLMTCSDSASGFYGQVTASAVDGSDVRVLGQRECEPAAGCTSFDSNYMKLSPSGTHVAALETLEQGDVVHRRVVLVPDADQPTPVPLTEYTTGWVSVVHWG